MTARPILFSAPMVRALLEGRKTQTRRTVTPSNTYFDGSQWPRGMSELLQWHAAWVDKGPSPAGNPGPYLKVPRDHGFVHRVYSKWQPGDVLWVREAWRSDDFSPDDVSRTIYAADVPADVIQETRGIVRARPSIHMPRCRSRLTLRITDVRVQRLHDISTEDAIAEGVEWTVPAIDASSARWVQNSVHIDRYARLWDEINGRGAWTTNPWIWALSFEVIRKNVDEVRS